MSSVYIQNMKELVTSSASDKVVLKETGVEAEEEEFWVKQYASLQGSGDIINHL